jgi:methionyl-tRNA formyltransferase
LKHEIDTGDVLLQESFPIDENETAGELHDRMKDIGALALAKTVHGILNGTIEEVPQQSANTETELKHAPRIFTETCKINWNDDTEKIHNLIRGVSPFPGAFTTLNGKILKIYRSEKVIADHSSTPGDHDTDGKSFFRFATKDGYLNVLDLQPEGKKRMPVKDFLNGWREQV